jgi:GT2 family glycosyltransferase
MANRQNKGYGDAINKAVRYGLKKYGNIDYFAILNNDLRLDENWLENLINYGEKKPECGILAGKMLIYYWPKYVNSTGGLVNYFGIGWDRDFFELDGQCQRESGEVLSVSGGAMLIKKCVFDAVGFFERKYFMYYEDIDFCFKVWKYSGYSVDYVNDSLVYHKFSASSGVMSLKKHFYLKRARFIFILRNYPVGFLAKIIPQIARYEFGSVMKNMLAGYDFVNFFREFYIFLIFLAKLPLIIGKRILTKDNKSRLNRQNALKMWNMVSTTTTNSGRKFIPMQYLDILWNRFEKYGEKTNRIIMGINDKGIGKGWKSLITNGNPRGRFFFNYADLVLENPYRGENYKYYFQLQYFLYDKAEEILSLKIENQLFKLKLKGGMNTAVLELPNDILRNQKEISIIFSFDRSISANDKKNTNLKSKDFLAGNMEKMNNTEFKEYVQNFRGLFVVEIALLSEDSQYLRRELSEV